MWVTITISNSRDIGRGSERKREREFMRNMHTRMDPARTRVDAIGCFHTQEQHISTRVGKHNPRATALQVVDRLSTTAHRASPWKKTQSSYVPSSASPFSHTHRNKVSPARYPKRQGSATPTLRADVSAASRPGQDCVVKGSTRSAAAAPWRRSP